MNNLQKEFGNIIKNDANLARIINICREIDHINEVTQEVINSISEHTPKVMNSANATIQLRHSQLSSDK